MVIGYRLSVIRHVRQWTDWPLRAASGPEGPTPRRVALSEPEAWRGES